MKTRFLRVGHPHNMPLRLLPVRRLALWMLVLSLASVSMSAKGKAKNRQPSRAE